MQGAKNPLNRSYSLFAFAVFFWSFGYFFWQVSTNAADALFWCRVLMAGAVLIPPSYFNFSLWLTGMAQEKKIEAGISWALGLVFFGLTFTPLMVSGVEKKMIFPFWPTPGLAYPFFLLMFFSLTIYALLIMFNVFKRAAGRLRAQIIYVSVGTAIGFAGGSTNFLLWYNIPVLPVANILVLAYCILLAYAIVKTHLMDISIVISRTVAEIFTILALGSVYVSLIWLYKTYVSDQMDLLFIIWSISFGVIVGHVYERIRLQFQTSSDKLFLHGRYDYYKALSDASARVGQKLSLENILQVLYDTFHEVVEISNPRVFLPEFFTEIERTSNYYLVYDKKTYQAVSDSQKIAMESQLVKELIATRKPILDIKEVDASLVVPCLLEDRLIAIFVLGHKLSEDSYTDEDLRLLEVLANQAAITLDHTRSYEKIRTDLESMERQLERSQRLASIGTLTAGVTHEIRNPLTVIRAETERLANQDRDLEYLKQHRELVLRHVDRITGIVQRMLGLAKVKEHREVEINLNEIIESTLELFPISRIKMVKNLQPVPMIKGDSEEMQEVFVNLIQNALEAMPNGGTLTLSTYTEEHRIVIEISDTGKGIPEELRERIFDPFFSTRHEGVGLGLSIVYRIVREHGGDIKVTSEPGKGSTFKILF